MANPEQDKMFCLFSVERIMCLFPFNRSLLVFVWYQHPHGMVIFEKKRDTISIFRDKKSMPVRIWGEEDVPWTFFEREITSRWHFSSDWWWQLNYFHPDFLGH